MFKQRDYPREILVGEQLWRVRFVRRFADRKQVGQCDASAHVISIMQGLGAAERLRVFVHEVVHALEAEYEFELAHDDVETLDEPLARLVIDNYLGNAR
jgi:hypothetical protein